MNTLEFAQVLQSKLDQKAVQTMKTGWMDANAGQVKYTGGAEVKVPTLTTQGLADYKRAGNEGFVGGGVSLTYKTYAMTQDRGRSFGLDANDVDETNFIAEATRVMGEFQTQNVIPEIDAYRISKIATEADASMTIDGYTPEEGTILTEIKKGIRDIRKQGYNGNLVIHISYDALTALELYMAGKLSSNTFSAGGFNTQCPFIDGVPLIATQDNAMYTAIQLYDGETEGQEEGGYIKGTTALDINFLIMPKDVPIAVTKQDNMRIFDPQTNQKFHGWAMDYRRYHDLWVLENKKKSIYLNTK